MTKARIDALTGLRFFAALVVYLSHHPRPPYLPAGWGTFFDSGYSGVTIFFVLSGFVIGLNYFESLSKPSVPNAIKYGIARFARVYPLYCIVILYGWWREGTQFASNPSWHLLAMQAWLPDLGTAFAFNGPAWSISVEFFLYACFPLIALAFAPIARRKKMLWGIALLTLLAMIGIALGFHVMGWDTLSRTEPLSAHRWLYRTPATRLGDFILGIVAALLFMQRGELGKISKRIWEATSYLAVLGILGLMLWQAHVFSVFSWDVSYAALAFFLVLGLGLAHQSFLARFLGMRTLVLLGESSYALYLIHVPMIILWQIDKFTTMEPSVALTLWILFAGLCILLSICLHKFIETPARNWINRLYIQPKNTLDTPKPQWIFSALSLIVILTFNFAGAGWLGKHLPAVYAISQSAGVFNYYSVRDINVQFDEGMRLNGYGLDAHHVQGGDNLWLLLRWTCQSELAKSFVIQLNLLDSVDREWSDGEDVTQSLAAPCQNNAWLGATPTTVAMLNLPIAMPAGEYRVVASVYDTARNESVKVYGSSGESQGQQLLVTPLRIAKNKSSLTANNIPIENRFFVDMREMRFLGYKNIAERIAPGSLLDIGLYWRARSKPRGDYQVAVQLRDARDAVLIEQVTRPAENTYPTTEWSEGEVLLDWHRLVIPSNLTTGNYQIAIVLRDAEHNTPIGSAILPSIITVK